MNDIITTDISKTKDSFLWEDLSNISVGLFLLNEEGFLVQYNQAVADILGIDEDNGWKNCHISKIDNILATGLMEQFDKIRNGTTVFKKKNISGTNFQGKYISLNIFCQRINYRDNGNGYIFGIIEDTQNSKVLGEENNFYIEELQILSDVSTALSSSNSLNQILNLILTSATASQGLGFNRAFLFLYDNDSVKLRGHMAVGPSSAEEAGSIWKNLESMRLSLSEMLDNETIDKSQQDKALNILIKELVFDLSKDSLLSKICQRSAWINLGKVNDLDPLTSILVDKLGTKDIALVPMVSKDKLKGLLVADNYITRKPISNNSVRLLQILANQAAVAMERAELYRQQKEQTQKLERMNMLLKNSQEQLIKIEKMSVIGELTSSIAHELRNPLTVIGGFASLMTKAGVTDEQKEYLNIITTETQRAESVLNHVLKISKASKNDSCAISFSKLIETNLELLLSRLHQTKIHIHLSKIYADMTVYGNFDQLSYAFYQLFKLVAEDLIPPGRAEIYVEQKDNKAHLNISIFAEKKYREKIIPVLKNIFVENKASQRLSILVAGEVIKFHGGEFGFFVRPDGLPVLYVQLPLYKEN